MYGHLHSDRMQVTGTERYFAVPFSVAGADFYFGDRQNIRLKRNKSPVTAYKHKAVPVYSSN